jgi:hypothetical protein
VWGQAGVYGTKSPSAIGAAGYGMGHNAVGVSGMADGTGGVAILGTASGQAALAGLFQGEVVVTGSCHPCVPADSARQIKPRPLQGALAKVMALKPRTYEVRDENIMEGVGDPSGPADRRYGFSAQEVQAVLPEVVHELVVPARLTPAEQWNTLDKGALTVQTMNYQELIPILVRAIQEQQAEIERLKMRER